MPILETKIKVEYVYDVMLAFLFIQSSANFPLIHYFNILFIYQQSLYFNFQVSCKTEVTVCMRKI
jgi:hypothetical protein